MDLSPELDLLEQLNGGDMPLAVASQIFPTLDRFKKVVDIFVRSGAVQLIQLTDDGERVVQPWELRNLTNDPAPWTGSRYMLRQSPQGSEQFVNDSQRFWKEFFAR